MLLQLLESAELADSVKDFISTFDAQEEWGGNMQAICSDDAVGNCAMVSNDLSAWLKKKGFAAEVITGHIAKNPDWAKSAKVHAGTGEDAHTVVQVGQQIVDLTARQFDRSMPFPRIIPLSKFKSEWKDTFKGDSQ